jgi:hypothetical protein
VKKADTACREAREPSPSRLLRVVESGHVPAQVAPLEIQREARSDESAPPVTSSFMARSVPSGAAGTQDLRRERKLRAFTPTASDARIDRAPAAHGVQGPGNRRWK